MAMINSIDKDGELTRTKAPISWYLTNFPATECLVISLPKDEKYLKYDQVNRTSKRIRKYQIIIAVTAPIMIICGAILLLTVK